MKFVIAAVVLLAVAMGVQSSIIPGLGLGLGVGVPGIGLGVHGLGLGVHGLGIGGAWHAGLAGGSVHVPGQSLSQGPGWLGGVPAAVDIAGLGHLGVGHLGAGLVGHGAGYVAKTRGAIHTAPLAGHVNSVASVNVAPAPGTW